MEGNWGRIKNAGVCFPGPKHHTPTANITETSLTNTHPFLQKHITTNHSGGKPTEKGGAPQGQRQEKDALEAKRAELI